MKAQQIILLSCLVGFACDRPRVQRLHAPSPATDSQIKTTKTAEAVPYTTSFHTFAATCTIEDQSCEAGTGESCCGDLWCSSELNSYGPATCQKPQTVGNFCMEDRQCASGRCSSHICRPAECLEQEEDCDRQNLPCCEGFICERDAMAYGVSRCVLPFENGEFCMDDGQCASGRCEDNICSDEQCKAEGEWCYQEVTCCGRLVCNQQAYGQGNCVEPFANGEFCIDSEQCASKVCTNNACSPN